MTLLRLSTMIIRTTSLLVLFGFLPCCTHSLNIVIAGGTGKVGRLLSSTLHNRQSQVLVNNNSKNISSSQPSSPLPSRSSSPQTQQNDKITILSRNVFLASAPSRVSEAFGWLGESFLNKHYSIQMRDWDGGDLLDIVGCDWQGWQEDVLRDADVIVNLVGGYTDQRTKACERLVRESLRLNPTVQHILLSLEDEDLKTSLKKNRAKECEDMLMMNCRNVVCLRAQLNDVEGACEKILQVMDDCRR